MRAADKRLPNYHGQDPRGGKPVYHGWDVLPALTVLPWLRYPVGNKVAKPLNAIINAAFLTFATPFIWAFIFRDDAWNYPRNIGLPWLMAFAWGCAAVCFAVWAWRVFRLMQSGREQQAGGQHRVKPVHQMEAGYSWAARLLTPLPLWLTELFLVPAAFIWAGWCFLHGPSLDLGLWLFVVGFSLAVLGFTELRHRVGVSGSITDMHAQGSAAGASLGAFASNTRGGRRAGSDYAEDANAGLAPGGLAMRAEGNRGGGLFLVGFGRKGGRKAPGAGTGGAMAPAPQARRGDKGGTTYAEAGE